MEKLVSSVAHADNEAIEHVSSRDISATSDAMLNNKTGDCYGLRAEHYKLAGDLYCSALASCFNVMLTHGHIPVDATQTIICPTVKDKKGDLSSISNYRPIALATSFSKILEHIILDRIYEHLNTTDNQFGFYSARNTRIASAVLPTAIPSVRPSVRLSVCPSVRHTPVLCQNDGTKHGAVCTVG